MSQQGSGPPARPRRPPALLVAAVVAAAEALVLVGVAVAAVAVTLTAGGSLLAVVPLVVLPLAIAAGLVFAARGLLRGRRWARAPVVTWQLFQVVLLQPALDRPSLLPWAVALLVVSVVAVVAVLTPAARRATAGPAPPPLT